MCCQRVPLNQEKQEFQINQVSSRHQIEHAKFVKFHMPGVFNKVIIKRKSGNCTENEHRLLKLWHPAIGCMILWIQRANFEYVAVTATCALFLRARSTVCSDAYVQ